jgi:hypothetical protein
LTPTCRVHGNARQDIFFDDTDRAIFLDVLAAMVERYGWHVTAYCLMDNSWIRVHSAPQRT